MAPYVILRHLVTILLTDLTNPINLGNDLLILKSLDNNLNSRLIQATSTQN